VSWLLFATDLELEWRASRCFSLSLRCWMERQDASGQNAALASMVIYNLLVTPYLIYLGIGGKLVGILLWPAAAVHAVFTFLVAYALMPRSRTG
jgi:hypothetical protein